MKKILLFVACATLGFASCSSDDNSNDDIKKSKLVVTIDGSERMFNTVDVYQEIHPEDSDFNFVRITASIDNDPDEIIAFIVDENKTGSSAIRSIEYIREGKKFQLSNDNSEGYLTSIVEMNSNGRLKGTFAGRAIPKNGHWDLGIDFTNGSFDINYKKK